MGYCTCALLLCTLFRLSIALQRILCMPGVNSFSYCHRCALSTLRCISTPASPPSSVDLLRLDIQGTLRWVLTTCAWWKLHARAGPPPSSRDQVVRWWAWWT